MDDAIKQTEAEIAKLVQKLEGLRKESPPMSVKNYMLHDLQGEVTLLALFGEKEQLLAIHNMGQGCRYCTLWADGLNGLVQHLEDTLAVVLLSKDPPQVQRQFANARQWRFRMVSHDGNEYIREQSVLPGEGNAPGVVCYERQGDAIFRKNASVFGPGDLFCAQWHLLSVAGVGTEDWTPQYCYWHHPAKLDDGGKNVR